MPNEKCPVLIKMKLPYSWFSEVFSNLEVMSISGSTMFLSAEGVAKDVYNGFNYHPRAEFHGRTPAVNICRPLRAILCLLVSSMAESACLTFFGGIPRI